MPKAAAMKLADIRAAVRRLERSSVKPDENGFVYVRVHDSQMKLARTLERRGAIQLVALTPKIRKHLI